MYFINDNDLPVFRLRKGGKEGGREGGRGRRTFPNSYLVSTRMSPRSAATR